VFLTGTNGILYVDQFSPVAGGWSWASLGNPGGVQFASSPAVINYSVGSATYENVFLTGTNGILYADQFSPVAGGWSWENLGNPGGVQFASSPAVINYSVGSATYENVFLTGTKGILYADQFSPVAGGWSWENLGNPGAGVLFISDPISDNYTSGGSAAADVIVSETFTRQTSPRLSTSLDVLDSAIEIDFSAVGIAEVAGSSDMTAADGYDELDFVLPSGRTAGRQAHQFLA
jgi:hypothetical protein